MGLKSSQRVWEHSKAEGSALLVLLAIADWCDNATGWTRPTTEQSIARKTRTSERTVRRVIKALEEKKELLVVRKNGQANVYGIAGVASIAPVVMMAQKPATPATGDPGQIVQTPATGGQDPGHLVQQGGTNTTATPATGGQDPGHAVPQIARENGDKQVLTGIGQQELQPRAGADAHEGAHVHEAAAAADRGADKNLSENRVNAFSAWEQVQPGSLGVMLAEEIKADVAEFGEAMVLEAIRETALSGGRNYKYVRGILERCRRENTKPGQPASQKPAAAAPVEATSAFGDMTPERAERLARIQAEGLEMKRLGIKGKSMEEMFPKFRSPFPKPAAAGGA